MGHGVAGMMARMRRRTSVTQQKRGQGGKRAFLTTWQNRYEEWDGNFQLDGIVEVRLGVHGCSVMEEDYSWRLSAADGGLECFSPWHAWALFVPTVVSCYCSAALVQNAALQTCRAVKRQQAEQQSTAAVANKEGRRSEFARGGCIRQYHEQRSCVTGKLTQVP